MTPEWLASWWRAYGAGRQLCSLAFVDTQRRTLAIAPLYLERSSRFGITTTTLRLVGAGSGDSDDLDFIVMPGYEAPVAQAFAEWFQSQKHCDVCALETLPDESLLAGNLVWVGQSTQMEADDRRTAPFLCGPAAHVDRIPWGSLPLTSVLCSRVIPGGFNRVLA